MENESSTMQVVTCDGAAPFTLFARAYSLHNYLVKVTQA
jgi:hypothetical protein